MKTNRIKRLKETIIQTLSQDLRIPSLFWDIKGWNFCHIFKLNLESTKQSDLKGNVGFQFVKKVLEKHPQIKQHTEVHKIYGKKI